MEKAILSVAFSLLFGLGVSYAQGCMGAAAAVSGDAPKSCCRAKLAAAKAAAADPTIEKRIADDGAVSYVRRETDAQGNVRFVSVRFDEATNTFVNVAPPSVSASATEGLTKKACSAEAAKACAGQSGAKACAGKAEGKACCAAKKAAAVEQKK
ncbi:MAG: hypothetical protein NZM43_08695 [Saprospiraceae bacterium]|nr:hypothetical protein [Saprospiraceae bacterium]MDW8484389.1 hypothetical protein [Saprospiraceae bacterium]